MASQKERNSNEMTIALMDFIHEIKIHRGSNIEVLTKYQHRVLDGTIEDAMKLIQISIDMASKKEVGDRVAKIIERIRYNMMDVLPIREMNCMNPLYRKYLVFISVAKDVLDKYLYANRNRQCNH